MSSEFRPTDYAKRFQAKAREGRTSDWYRMAKADKDDDTVIIDLYDEIGWFGTSAADFVRELRATEAKTVELHINSPGGSVYDGIAIMNALKAHPARVVAIVDGLAASAASFIAVGGSDELLMAKHSELMVHDAWGLAIGPAEDLRKLADDLDRLSNNLASIYAEKAGGTVDEWRAVMREETWYSDKEAVAAGLADKVLDLKRKTDDKPSNRFDLSVFNFAGRAEAPPPRLPRNALPDPVPAPELPAPEPEPITEPVEDTVSDLSDIARGLGLPEDAGKDQILAAITVREKVEPEPEPETDPAASPEPQAPPAPATGEAEKERDELRKEVNMLATRMEVVTAELAATKAKEAAATKASILDAAQKAGKFTPADRAQWEQDYDEAPNAVARMLDRIAAYSAVPGAPIGHAGVGADESGGADALYAAVYGTGA